MANANEYAARFKELQKEFDQLEKQAAGHRAKMLQIRQQQRDIKKEQGECMQHAFEL